MRRTVPVVLVAATLALGLLPACSAASQGTRPFPVGASETPTIHPTPDPSVETSPQVDRLTTAKKVGTEFGIVVERATGQPKLSEAQAMKRAVEERLRRCKLEAHPDKTRIVYCRDSNRRQDHEHIQFDFLGYSFRPREAMNHFGKLFTSFSPGISGKAQKAIVGEIRNWRIHRKSDRELADLAEMFNKSIRGWINYYGRYYFTALRRALDRLNRRLVRWACGKYKRFRGKPGEARRWLCWQCRQRPSLFAHWHAGIIVY
jgi:hypothetical protein